MHHTLNYRLAAHLSQWRILLDLMRRHLQQYWHSGFIDLPCRNFRLLLELFPLLNGGRCGSQTRFVHDQTRWTHKRSDMPAAWSYVFVFKNGGGRAFSADGNQTQRMFFFGSPFRPPSEPARAVLLPPFLPCPHLWPLEEKTIAFRQVLPASQRRMMVKIRV